MRIWVSLLMFGLVNADGEQVPRVDDLIVSTSRHTLTLYAQGKPVRVYKVALGSTAGPKDHEGDHKTPTGHYTIDGHKPDSLYHRALHVSYPNAEDRRRAAAEHLPPGGDIMIHGLPDGLGLLGAVQHLYDWTSGCIALSNSEVDDVYKLVPNGTPLDIEP